MSRSVHFGWSGIVICRSVSFAACIRPFLLFESFFETAMMAPNCCAG
jgi:hypothetical protein